MTTENDVEVWLHERHEITIIELADCAGLSEAEVRELVEYGALVPADAMNWTFSSGCVGHVRAAMRLRRDLELDTAAFALVVSFLERIGELEAQVRQLGAQVQRPRS
jgi:hypothetical protein